MANAIVALNQNRAEVRFSGPDTVSSLVASAVSARVAAEAAETGAEAAAAAAAASEANRANLTLSNATTQPDKANAVAKPVHIKAREFLSVDDFRGSLVDDATALNRALTAAFEGGDSLPVRFFDSLDIDAPITLPQGAHLIGPISAADQIPVGGPNGLALEQGVLRVAADATIHVGFASKLDSAKIIRLGMTEPGYVSQAFAAIAAFAGTAITAGSVVGFEAENLQILGFARAMDFSNNGRGRLRNIRIDCTNGVRWQGSLDVSRLENVHCWPWMTVGHSASDARVLWRAGVGIEIGAPSRFTGSASGTTLTVTAVTAGTPLLYVGQSVYDGLTLVGIITAVVSGTGGVGTYMLDRSASVSSKPLRAFIQNDWTNVESCFTFGMQIGFQLDEARHATIQNCASDNASQLLFGPYNTEAQSKIGLNIQGESYNTNVIGYRGAAQGTGMLVQPSTASAAWAPRVIATDCRFWGNGTHHVNQQAGEMVLTNVSTESIFAADAGHAITLGDGIVSADISLPAIKPPTIAASATALAKARISDRGVPRPVTRTIASADPLPLTTSDQYVVVTGNTNFGTVASGRVGQRVTLLFTGTPILLNNPGVVEYSGQTNVQASNGLALDLVMTASGWREVGRVSTNGAAGWVSSSPAVTSTIGTLTSASCSLRTRLNADGMVDFVAAITITTRGTADGSLLVTLPYASEYTTTFPAREGAVNGFSGSGTLGAASAVLTIQRYDNAFIGANGAVIYCAGSYRADV
jgi:hypothetical protein